MKLQRIVLADLFPSERTGLVRRNPVPDAAVRDQAAAIVADVRERGDAAFQAANRRFGGGRPLRPQVDRTEMEEALAGIDPALRNAIETVADRIRRFHETQVPLDQEVETAPGVTITRRWSPLRRVGAYVPGGKAAYPSSLLMTVIPARVAGVESIAVVSPAGPGGEMHPVLLATAALSGVDRIEIGGGAQAIAALAYGTESIEPVDKIVGPGNAWVTAAKLIVLGQCGIDLPAGPSEGMVVADAAADARLVAADMAVQAEHGPDSPVWLVTADVGLADRVEAALTAFVSGLPNSEALHATVANRGRIVIAPDHASGLEFARNYAPEHVSFHTADPAADAASVPTAGSTYLGPWSAMAAGDYATGANHVLPTGGLARAYGPLGVADFGSWRQEQTLTGSGLAGLRETIVTLANSEGLPAHARNVAVRFEEDR